MRRRFWIKQKQQKRPETGTSGNTHDMKDEYIVGEIRPATSSTLSEERITKMQKRIEEIAPVCSIYDVDFQNLV